MDNNNNNSNCNNNNINYNNNNNNNLSFISLINYLKQLIRERKIKKRIQCKYEIHLK